jgi:hypothetical protein
MSLSLVCDRWNVCGDIEELIAKKIHQVRYANVIKKLSLYQDTKKMENDNAYVGGGNDYSLFSFSSTIIKLINNRTIQSPLEWSWIQEHNRRDKRRMKLQRMRKQHNNPEMYDKYN